MNGSGVDIFKQTIAGYDIATLLRLMPKAKRPAGEAILKRIWVTYAGHAAANHATIVGGGVCARIAEAIRPTPAPDALPEIRHTDKIEVRSISDEFAEVSETTWQKLKGELFQAGLDENDVRLIARSLAKGVGAVHGGGASPRYEYRKVQANG